MKNFNKLFIVLLLLLSTQLMPSCTNGFKELSINPNATEYALPQGFLAPAITDVVDKNMNRAARRVNNELMQVHVTRNDAEPRFFRYEIRPSEADYFWNNWFLQLTNFNNMYSSAVDLFEIEGNNSNKTFMGIALVCQVWVTSLLTDTYGDIPYFEANKGREGILMPRFDTQEEIYKDMFEKLEEANELLAINADIPGDVANVDPIYGGVALKWRRFGNSLYLRLLLRLSERPEMNVAQKVYEIITTPANYPIMLNNDDSAILKWSGVVPYQSSFYNMQDVVWTRPALASFFVDNLVNWRDPRVARWATRSQGEYAGIPSGYPIGNAPPVRSRPPLALKREPLLGNIMNYAELQFILAEACVREWYDGDAQSFYEAGVTAGINLWGYNLPAGYLDDIYVRWEEMEDFGGKMDKIHVQKYYALYYTDFQQWFEYRRTGALELPKGEGLMNNGEMPSRLNYPTYLQTTNRDHYNDAVARQGADEINTRVWWQQP